MNPRDTIAAILKVRDENVLPSEVDDNERDASADYILSALTAAGHTIVGPAGMAKAVEAACTEHWTGWGEWSEFRKDKEREVMRAALTAAWPHMPVPAGLSEWHGWDESRLPWSASKHKDAVCEAVFRQLWSVEDAEALIGFIERTWPRASAPKPAALTQEPKTAEGEK